MESVVASLTDAASLTEVQDLFLHKKQKDFFVPPRSELAIRKGLEISFSKIAWLERYGDEILQALDEDRLIWIFIYG